VSAPWSTAPRRHGRRGIRRRGIGRRRLLSLGSPACGTGRRRGTGTIPGSAPAPSPPVPSRHRHDPWLGTPGPAPAPSPPVPSPPARSWSWRRRSGSAGFGQRFLGGRSERESASEKGYPDFARPDAIGPRSRGPRCNGTRAEPLVKGRAVAPDMLDSGPLSGFRHWPIRDTRRRETHLRARYGFPRRRAAQRLARGLSDRSGDPINDRGSPQRHRRHGGPARPLRFALGAFATSVATRLIFNRGRVAVDIEVRKSNISE
jgi:hypothetical protein